MLDVYIQQHLKSTQAHYHLIACVRQIFSKIDAPQSFKLVMPTLKVSIVLYQRCSSVYQSDLDLGREILIPEKLERFCPHAAAE